MSDYHPDDFRNAIAQLPLQRGDLVFLHSHLPRFGRPALVRDKHELCQHIYDSIVERIGPEGTIIVPTFTYSFPRKEVFDVTQPAPMMGMFSEWIRTRPESVRSHDPCYSVAAVGALAEAITKDVPENAFGEDSLFDRFYKHDGKILSLSSGAGSTFAHYVERCLNVFYRFDKTFTGIIRTAGGERDAKSTIYVRYLSDDSLEAAWRAMDVEAKTQGLLAAAPVGRGEVHVISAADTFALIERTLPERPLFLTKAEELGITDPVIIPEETQQN